jgi:hypothetical protein
LVITEYCGTSVQFTFIKKDHGKVKQRRIERQMGKSYFLSVFFFETSKFKKANQCLKNELIKKNQDVQKQRSSKLFNEIKQLELK